MAPLLACIITALVGTATPDKLSPYRGQPVVAINIDAPITENPEELKKITSGSKKIFDALGSRRIQRVETIKRIEAFRRSIVARKRIKKGQIIKKNMLDFKRPGTGLEPSNLERIVGKRTKRNIQFDEILKEEDF